jgi:putative intracellular protease/amidase
LAGIGLLLLRTEALPETIDDFPAGVQWKIAGVLKGVEATCYVTEESKKEMRKGAAVFIEKPVMVSGNIVTANGPSAARDFGKALVSAISKG